MCLSLFGWKVNILTKMHIVHWSIQLNQHEHQSHHELKISTTRFYLYILCSLLHVISAKPAFFALGGTPLLHKDTLGSFVFCLACDLLCFLFVFCLAAVKERVDQGPA